MGKKTKVGKQRRDKFYHLAKETGYRSRAAFKLIQLNRKYEFLQKSRVLVDLCAAPGGWMQVAAEHMPVSSVVIGVDLYPIKSIPGCISLQSDITTPQCLQMIKKELKTWSADVVLNDGAPNVGQNWVQDAYEQNLLTLSAIKLATKILRPGGYFVTKVFRSKDYNSLIWVLQQLFSKVISTKPAASRHESAEIFVFCKGYIAPNTIDPKLLDPKHVFEEVESNEKKKQLKQLLLEVGKKRKADGYIDGETLIYRPINASEFIRSNDFVELLSNTSKIILDEDWIKNNEKTTEDIKHYCKDVKVIGKKEIKALVQWRKVLRAKLEQYMKSKQEDCDMVTTPMELVEEDSDTDNDLEKSIREIQVSELKDEKRKRRKLEKSMMKLNEKKSLDMIIPGDTGPTDTSEDVLFSLTAVKNQATLDAALNDPEMPEIEEEQLDSDTELRKYEEKQRKKKVRFARTDASDGYYGMEENDSKGHIDDVDPDLNSGLGLEGEDVDLSTVQDINLDEVDSVSENPLLTDLDYSNKTEKRLRKAAIWFDQEKLRSLNSDSDEDEELEKLAESYRAKGIKVACDVGVDHAKHINIKDEKPPKMQLEVTSSDCSDDEGIGDDEGLEDIDGEYHSLGEIGNRNKPSKRKKLDVEGLALASVMIHSKKAKRNLMDDAWNRYTSMEDYNLPDWFVSDEAKHMKKEVSIPEASRKEYNKRLEELGARTIKKVVEAKARKKKRILMKMKNAQKRAEGILEKTDLTDSEKANQIKQLYKKAKKHKKKDVKYVVVKRSQAGKKMRAPSGSKGPVRYVDPRMKKDIKRLKQASKSNKKHVRMKAQQKLGKGKRK